MTEKITSIKDPEAVLQHNVKDLIENYVRSKKYSLASVISVQSILKKLITKVEGENDD